MYLHTTSQTTSSYIHEMLASLLIDNGSLSNSNDFLSTSKQVYSKAVGGPVFPISQPTAITNSFNNILTVSNETTNKSASQRYKTELCRSFDETGYCKYGEKCQFAHGYHEIRSLTRHPKYKTVLCRTYHCTGYCPYGPRCHFLHDESPENVNFSSKSSSISPSSSFAGDIRSSASSSRSISPMESPMMSTDENFFLPSFLSDQ